MELVLQNKEHQSESHPRTNEKQIPTTSTLKVTQQQTQDTGEGLRGVRTAETPSQPTALRLKTEGRESLKEKLVQRLQHTDSGRRLS